MNCCDANGDCTGGPGCAARTERTVRSCEELGVCQGDHRGPFAFAPGVIEGHKVGLLGSPAQRRELLRWAKGSLAFLTLVGLSALAAGLLTGLWP